MKLIILLFSIILCVSSETVIQLAAIDPMDQRYEPQCRKAMELALTDIDLDGDLLPNASFSIQHVPILGAKETTENLELVAETLFDNTEIVALVGFYSSGTLNLFAILGDAFKIPIISSSATNPKFSDKEVYPYVSRVIGSGGDTGYAHGEIIAESGFERAALITASDSFGLGIISAVETALIEAKVQLIGTESHKVVADYPADEIIAEMDKILLDFKSQGATVIIYSGHIHDGRLILWRAYKNGMLGKQDDGTVYQWLLTELCINGILDDCVTEECIDDLEAMRDQLIGTMCMQPDFAADEDWFNNQWTPAVSPENLTPEDIVIAETDDWINDWNPYSVFSYDVVIMAAKAITKHCNERLSDNVYSTYEECYADLPNKGYDIVEQIPTIQFYGATEDIAMNENQDRVQKQAIYQWLGTAFQKSALWIPHQMRGSGSGSATNGQEALKFVEPLLYASRDGKPPEIMNSAAKINIAMMLGSVLMILVMIGSSAMIIAVIKSKVIKGKGRNFFADPVIFQLIVSSTCFAAFQYTNMMTVVSPFSIEISVVSQYVAHIPMIMVFASLGSRIYRFYRVTNNVHLKILRFSKHHRAFSILGASLIAFIGMGIRIYFNIQSLNDINDSSNILQFSHRIQDSDLTTAFTVNQPIFDLYEDETYYDMSFWLHFICSICFMMALLCFIVILAVMAQTVRLKQNNVKLASELRSLQKGSALIMLVLLVEFIYRFLDHNEAAASAHPSAVGHLGFDNGKAQLTISQLRTICGVQFICSLLVWTCIMGIILDVRFKLFLYRVLRAIHLHRTGGGSSSKKGGSSATASSGSAGRLSGAMAMYHVSTLGTLSAGLLTRVKAMAASQSQVGGGMFDTSDGTQTMMNYDEGKTARSTFNPISLKEAMSDNASSMDSDNGEVGSTNKTQEDRLKSTATTRHGSSVTSTTISKSQVRKYPTPNKGTDGGKELPTYKELPAFNKNNMSASVSFASNTTSTTNTFAGKTTSGDVRTVMNEDVEVSDDNLHSHSGLFRPSENETTYNSTNNSTNGDGGRSSLFLAPTTPPLTYDDRVSRHHLSVVKRSNSIKDFDAAEYIEELTQLNDFDKSQVIEKLEDAFLEHAQHAGRTVFRITNIENELDDFVFRLEVISIYRERMIRHRRWNNNKRTVLNRKRVAPSIDEKIVVTK